MDSYLWSCGEFRREPGSNADVSNDETDSSTTCVADHGIGNFWFTANELDEKLAYNKNGWPHSSGVKVMQVINPNEDTKARIFVSTLLVSFGTPEVIITDQDLGFTSKEFCDALGQRGMYRVRKPPHRAPIMAKPDDSIVRWNNC